MLVPSSKSKPPKTQQTTKNSIPTVYFVKFVWSPHTYFCRTFRTHKVFVIWSICTGFIPTLRSYSRLYVYSESCIWWRSPFRFDMHIPSVCTFILWQSSPYWTTRCRDKVDINKIRFS